MKRRPPPDPTYFLDENMESHKLADLLTAAGLRCVRISSGPDPFGRSMADEEWIPLVASLGWWGVTCDRATLKVRPEIEAIRNSKAVHIVLRAKDLGIPAMASALIKAHRVLVVKIPSLTRPAILYVHHDGKVVVDEGQRRGDVRR